MNWAGLDQRAFPRVSTRCDITISDRIGGTLQTKTQNVGVGGVCVILNRELEKLSQVKLRLMLNDASSIECKARVCWMIKSREFASGKATYDIGLEFLDLPQEDRLKIRSFLGRFKK